ncbi:MAG TPA: hypothetical protein VE175_06485, partial [Woeseiaceae bacterium]|nr:hypothetical protein [Woeseiaceae bacterium]
TFHLQKELAHRPGFLEWYGAKQEAMRADDVLKFFDDTRDMVVHREPGRVHKLVSASLEPAELLVLGTLAEARVIRGRPWYRRRPAILWQDARAWFLRPLHRLALRVRQRWRVWKHRRAARRRSTGDTITESFHFEGSRFRDRDVFDLLDEYLDALEAIVAEAEARFVG